MNEIKNLGEKIKFYREKANISRNQMAKYCGISMPCISLLEKGGRAPTLTTLVKIANYLKVPLSKFINDDYTSVTEEQAFFVKFNLLKNLNKDDQKLVLKIIERLQNRE